MRRLLSKPRRVLLRLLGVKRRRRYNNKNKYVAMLLNHDKQLKTLNKKCFTVPMFDMFLKAGHKELEDKINAMAKADMTQVLECRIGEVEDRINDLTKVDSNIIDCMDNLEAGMKANENCAVEAHNQINTIQTMDRVDRKLYDEALTKRDCRIEDLEDEVTHLKAEIQELLQTN